MTIDIRKTADLFQSNALPKSKWTHSAHIAVAFVELDTLKDFEKTLASLRSKIKAYNISVGTENTVDSGYHETLTVFWLKVIERFYSSNSEYKLEELFDKFMRTAYAETKFPSFFFSRELLFSAQARQHWTDPDLLPISDLNNITLKEPE